MAPFLRFLRIRGPALLLPAVLLVTGCAYFNTFYNAQGYYREGVALSKSKQVGQAKGKFEKSVEKSALVLSKWPRSRWADDATFLIGQCYYEMGQYGKAIRHFDQLALAFPQSELVPRARYYRGLALLRNREYGPARVILDQVRRDYPKFRDGATFNIASSFYEREDWARAADSLGAFLDRFPKSPNRLAALHELAVSCERLGRWEECEQWYRRLAELSSDPKERAAARLDMAGAMIARGHYAEALPVVTELIGRYSELNDEAYVLQGRSLAEAGRADEAMRTWRNVKGSSDLGAEAYFRIGKFHEEQKDFLLARAHYDTARSRRANSDHGVLAVKRLALLEAIARSDSAGVREPAEAKFLIAEVMNLNLGEYGEAKGLYQQVVDSFPDSDWAPKAMLARAWVTRNALNDSAGSVPELQSLIARYPKTEYANEAKRWLGLPAPPRPKPQMELKPSPPVPEPQPAPPEPTPQPGKPGRPTGLPGEEMPPGVTPEEEGRMPVERPREPVPPPEGPREPGPTPPGFAPEQPVPPIPPETPVREPPVPPKPPAENPPPAAGDSTFAAVHFEYDRWEVRNADGETLGRIAAWLREHPDRRLTITGYCDPRGTGEYNLALGLRRAQAVRDWLEQAGIEAVRTDTATRGEDDTLSRGPDDYWRDRRVEFSRQ